MERTTDEILSELRSLDVRLWVEGDRLRLSAPKGALSQNLQEELARRKAELLSYLEMVEAASRAPTPIVPLDRGERAGSDLALSFGQERLWFLHRLETESTAYNIPVEIRFRGDVDVASLEEAIGEIVRRHEVLRSLFPDVEGSPVQRPLEAMRFRLSTVDLGRLEPRSLETELDRLKAEHGRQRFDLARRPPWRAILVELSPKDHMLLFAQHHIVTDRWSLGIFVRELDAIYRAFSRSEASPLPELPFQYADFAAWQRAALEGGRLRRQLDYWRAQLSPPLPVVELPLDAPRPPSSTFEGAWESDVLEGALLQGLKTLGREEGATLFMVLLAAFDVLVHRSTGLEDVLIGTPVAGRNERETESLIGFFVNTLVMRTDLSGRPSFRELLRRVRRVALEAFTHQEVPFEKIVEEVPVERRLDLNPLFQLMLVLQNTPPLESPPADSDDDDDGAEITFTATGGASLDLTLYCVDRETDLVVTAEYNTDLFERDTIVALLSNWRRLLEDAVERPDGAISELEVLSAGERKRILLDWNRTDAPYDGEACLHHLFERQVDRTPGAIAVVSDEESVTYRELERRANRLAHFLRAKGAGPERLVGLCLRRRVDLVVALLATLKAGAAYVPLDPAYPEARLALMAADSGALLVLTDSEAASGLASDSREVVRLDEVEASLPASEKRPERAVRSGNVVYVLYTSGSTGIPKGVAIAHRSAVALIEWAKTVFGPEEVAGVAFTTSISFDLSVFELFLPLSTGGTVLVFEDALSLLSSERAGSVRLLNTVPSAMETLLRSADSLDSLRTVCLAGEPLSRQLVEEIHERTGAGRVLDLYGPSEDTTYTTFALRSPEESATIGRPIANTRVYVLDEALSPVPRGVPGELCIAGDGLARGYLGRPGQTAETFVPDPFSSRPGSRLYRTGDIARHRPDGQLEYLGRRDHQVKLRGFRIELGEIEEALRSHEAIEAAVVLVVSPGADAALVAYVVSGAGSQPTVTELRKYVRTKLPAHMVPAMYVFLDAFPHTPNGKIDRRALSAAEATPSRAERHVPPRTEAERSIAAVWTELLSVERVGIHDNFFDLGGHSLMSIRAIARIEKATGVRLGVRDLMFQTLEQCAACCESAQSSPDDVSPPGVVGRFLGAIRTTSGRE